MTKIMTIQVPEVIQPDHYNKLLTKVSEEKREKIRKFFHIKDSYRSLLGELLVRATVCNHTSKNNEDIGFVFNHYGKPFLVDCPSFSFNISHSGNWVVLIWSDQHQALGVDVEIIKPMEMDIAERFFSPSECMDLRSKQGVEQLEYFFRLWTLKESYIKAQGMGLSIPLNEFSLSWRNGNVWFSPEANNFHFKSFRLDQDHFLSACSDYNDLPNEIKELPFDQLYDYWDNSNRLTK